MRAASRPLSRTPDSFANNLPFAKTLWNDTEIGKGTAPGVSKAVSGRQVAPPGRSKTRAPSAVDAADAKNIPRRRPD